MYGYHYIITHRYTFPRMTSEDLRKIRVEDYLHVAGVRLADPDTPHWKLKPLKERNMKIIQQYLILQEQEKEKLKEEEKWQAIPDWKRPLLLEREKRRKEQEEAQKLAEELERREQEKFNSLPPWKQEVLRKKRASESTSDSKMNHYSLLTNHFIVKDMSHNKKLRKRLLKRSNSDVYPRTKIAQEEKTCSPESPYISPPSKASLHRSNSSSSSIVSPRSSDTVFSLPPPPPDIIFPFPSLTIPTSPVYGCLRSPAASVKSGKITPTISTSTAPQEEKESTSDDGSANKNETENPWMDMSNGMRNDADDEEQRLQQELEDQRQAELEEELEEEMGGSAEPEAYEQIIPLE